MVYFNQHVNIDGSGLVDIFKHLNELNEQAELAFQNLLSEPHNSEFDAAYQRANEEYTKYLNHIQVKLGIVSKHH